MVLHLRLIGRGTYSFERDIPSCQGMPFGKLTYCTTLLKKVGYTNFLGKLLGFHWFWWFSWRRNLKPSKKAALCLWKKYTDFISTEHLVKTTLPCNNYLQGFSACYVIGTILLIGCLNGGVSHTWWNFRRAVFPRPSHHVIISQILRQLRASIHCLC